MSFFKKIGKAFRSGIKKVGQVGKKVLKYAAPVAAIAAPFIPGVGKTIAGAVSKIGGWLGGGSSAQSNAAAPPPSSDQVQVTGQRDPFDWAGFAGNLASTAIPAFMGYYSQQKQNSAQAAQAQKQMDFQAEQTGTSYQRGVADMKAAGLNPMLAYSQGGAASGGGAQANIGNEGQAGMSSAIQAMMTRQQIQQMQAQVENIHAQTENTDQDTRNKVLEGLFTTARTGQSHADTRRITESAQEIALRNYVAQATQRSQIELASSSADLRRHEAAREGYLAKASKYDLSRAGAWSKFYDSGPGQKYPLAISSAEVANSAAGAIGKLNPFKFGK